MHNAKKKTKLNNTKGKKERKKSQITLLDFNLVKDISIDFQILQIIL